MEKKQLATTNELCEYFNVSRITIERYRKAGLPYKIIGTRSVRFDLEEVYKWMEEHKFNEVKYNYRNNEEKVVN